MDEPDASQWPYRAGSHSYCPACGKAELNLRPVLRARPPGTFSLAGAQLKVTALESWEYLCRACGDTGPCAIRESYSTVLSEEAT